MNSKERLLFFLIIIVGIFFRCYKLDLIEFKRDELKAIFLGLDAIKGNWWIKHGMISGVGIPNAPAFSYIMGFFTFLNKSPVNLTMYFTIINSFVLLFSVLFFSLFIKEKKYFILSIFLFSFSPYLIIYSRKIWAQNLLLVFILPLIVLCFYAYKKQYLFPFIGILSSIVFQLHQSGIFFVGLLVISIIIFSFIYKSKIQKASNNCNNNLFKLKTLFFLIIAIAAFITLMLPYLDFIINDNGYKYFLSGKNRKYFGGNVFYTILLTATGGSFWLYHINNLKSFFSWPITGFPIVFLIFGNVLIFPFIIGLYVLTQDLIIKKGNKTFSLLKESFETNFMVISSIFFIVALYFILAIDTHPHYYIIIFPFLIIVLSRGLTNIFERKNKLFKYLKLLVIIGLVSYALQYPFLFSYMILNNGELREYGITYREQERIVRIINERFIDQKNILLNGIIIGVDNSIPYKQSKINDFQETIKYIIKIKYDKNINFIQSEDKNIPSLWIKNYNKKIKFVLD